MLYFCKILFVIMAKDFLKFSLLIIVIISFVGCKNKKQDLYKAEDKLIKIYQTETEMWEDQTDYKFGNAFAELLLSDSSTISYPFQRLKDSTDMFISTSQDGNLRIYSWDTKFGGTVPIYDNAFQFRSNGKVFSFKHTPWDYDENNNYIQPEEFCEYRCNFIKIHTVKIKDKTYYIVESYARYDSGHGVSSITAFTIENDNLRTEKIFKTKNDLLSDIYIEYCFRDWYFRANNGKGFDWIFSFDEKTNTLYVPLIDDKIEFGFVTDQYLLYQLKDNNLQYIGKDGGYWLYPSIRKFRYMETICETENFLIRIDKLNNGKYRYVSWNKNSKTMADKPDLIIENGSKYEDEIGDFNYSGYIFKTKAYEYEIRPTAQYIMSLVVTKNGKTILSEEIK